MTFSQRLEAVQANIRRICQQLNRDPAEVRLIAVSKRHSSAAISEAYAAGQIDFGENFAQELRDKSAEIQPNIRWHFIGRIQKNKAKYIAPAATRVHCLESVEQATALARRSPGTLQCLIGVNIGREEQKSGVLPEELNERIAQIARVEKIKLTGLMCLPPQVDDPEDTAPYFQEMQSLLDDLCRNGHPMNELSMGMSSDYHVALRYGATWVRVGSAIFGPRPPKT